MGLIKNQRYKKEEPWRDARLFVVNCEGSHTEPRYFDFFDRLTKKVRVMPIPSQGKTSPNHLLAFAHDYVNDFIIDEGDYALWFIVDVDQWAKHGHLQLLYKACKAEANWQVAISNPCFEVWLNAHFGPQQPTVKTSQCQTWKQHLHQYHSGFDPTVNPELIATAITNTKAVYQEDGFMPRIGATQVYRLGETLYSLCRQKLP